MATMTRSMHTPTRSAPGAAALERVSRSVDVASEGYWDWNLVTGEVFYSRRWCEMAGLPAVALRGDSQLWLDRVHPDDRAMVRSAIEGAGRCCASVQTGYRLLRADGLYRPMRVQAVVVCDEFDVPVSIAGWQMDMAPREVEPEVITAEAVFDAELRRALARNEFVLHYQPIVAASSGGIVAFEALIRWQHPVRGLLAPDQFLKRLQCLGMMVEVGRWVIREACEHCASWQRTGAHNLTVSINLSAIQLEDPEFAAEVAQIVMETKVDASRIIFEITEDLVIHNTRQAIDALTSLRATGIRLFIDDFGTGYSSLSYLQQLPVDGLKIDRAFLEEIEQESARREIVRAIIDLAHALGLEVVSEGVERPEQLEMLRTLGCDRVQGFLLAPPMNSDAADLLACSSNLKAS
ncbi:MAG: diguanylate cyclase/phosphodiesterase [Gemmatimonadetes bacterium]|nr:diguanylate cyclase/phosphodiesterase [Gemmatimonadota bacterium]